MIVRLKGKLVEQNGHSLMINVNGLCYEVVVPQSVLQRLDTVTDKDGDINLITYHYMQIEPSRGMPVLIGFINEIEKDFFQQFIKVSGIGPRAAVKALNKPISEITRAIEEGDVDFLKTLSGIGLQRAKEIIAKLQGKVGKFGLIQDERGPQEKTSRAPDWQQEALSVLLQLQYKRPEAQEMIKKALDRSQNIDSAEKLLNEIYKQKVRK